VLARVWADGRTYSSDPERLRSGNAGAEGLTVGVLLFKREAVNVVDCRAAVAIPSFLIIQSLATKGSYREQ
jgi:hypothetical protein